jgi:hypothetical protein
MKTITLLAIFAIIAALGASTSLIPIHQVSAAQGPNPGTPHSTANADDNAKQNACKHLTSAIHADFYC